MAERVVVVDEDGRVIGSVVDLDLPVRVSPYLRRGRPVVGHRRGKSTYSRSRPKCPVCGGSQTVRPHDHTDDQIGRGGFFPKQRHDPMGWGGY